MSCRLRGPRVTGRRGFTLLEMLVALAIVAVGLTASLRAAGIGTDAMLDYREHALALWLAQNILAERTARGDWPPPGIVTHEAELGRQAFLVRQEIKGTPNPQFRRLDVLVMSRDDPDRALQHSVAFLVRRQ